MWISLMIVIVMCFSLFLYSGDFLMTALRRWCEKKLFSSLRHPLLHLLRAHQENDNCESLNTWLLFQNYLYCFVFMFTVSERVVWFVGTVSLQFSFLCVDPFTLYLYLPDCNIDHIVYFNVLLLSGIGLKWLTLVILC